MLSDVRSKNEAMDRIFTARRFGRTLALSLALLAPAGAAAAQTAPYPGEKPAGDVLGNADERGDTQVQGVVTSRETPPASVSAVRAAPASRSLAVTGTDAFQLAGIGIVLVGGGLVLVRRSRRLPAPA